MRQSSEKVTQNGIERVVEKEMLTGLWLAAACAKKSFQFELRLVGTEVG